MKVWKENIFQKHKVIKSIVISRINTIWYLLKDYNFSIFQAKDLKDTNDNYIQFFKYFKETSIIHEDNSMWSL